MRRRRECTMENEENKSKWDELARDLGAPAAEPPDRPAASQPPGSADAKRSARGPARPPARPKPSTKDWDNLAADLGIQPPAAPRAAAPTTETEATPMSAEESPPHSTAPDASEKLPAPTEPVVTRPEPTSDVAAEAEQTARGGGVSLWHKIFGTPEQQAERIVETGRPSDTARVHEEHRQREDRPSRRGGRAADTRPRPEPSADDVEDAAAWREPAAELSPESTEEGREQREQHPPEDQESKRRRGRRRRRGRGKKVDGPATADMDEESRDDGRAPRKRGRRPAPLTDDATDAEFDFDDDLDATEPGEADDDDNGSGPDDQTARGATARGASPRHRNIPSWEEAIGLIVDVNMQSRSERRRTAPQKSARSGSSRGRSRGRRKKKT